MSRANPQESTDAPPATASSTSAPPRRLELADAPTLPRGRHNLPASEVRASQRARLLAAMLECVGEAGYGATTVPQVVARARVSQNAFYELFDDKLDCFLALADEMAEEILRQLNTFGTSGGDWLDALRRGTRRYLEWWQEHPAWTRAYLVELPSAGPRAVAHRQRQYGRFHEMFRGMALWARASHPDLPPLWPLAPAVIAHTITELVADRVRAGRTETLMELEADIVYLIVLLLADEATARAGEATAGLSSGGRIGQADGG